LQALKIPKRRNPIQTLEAEEVPKEEKCIFPVTRKKTIDDTINKDCQSSR
jgi:hypothetical protein